MNRLIPALALVPALFATGAVAQSVSEEVTRQLWCGTALTVAFTELPDDLGEDERAEIQSYIDGGNALIAEAAAAHLEAGFTQEDVDRITAEIVPVVTEQVTGDASAAQFSFEECAAILPGSPE